MLEDNLRRALRLSHGDPMVLLERPISLGLLLGGRPGSLGGGHSSERAPEAQ
jgi:hypothetical protein